MLTPYLPYPLISGGQIRSYNLLKNLSQKHKITLVALIKNESEKQYIKNIEPYCQEVVVARRPEKPWTFTNIIKTGIGTYPFLVVRNFSQEAKQAVIEKLKKEKFDLIHAETFYVMPHIPHTSVPTLLVEQTIEYLVYQHFVDTMRLRWLRPLFRVDVHKIRHWEEYYWKRATRVVAMSKADSDVMRERLPELHVSIVPNGVDTDFFTYKKKLPNREPKVLFVGNFKWLQNREAVATLVHTIWPLIIKKLPHAKLWIVGKYPTTDITAFSNDKIKVSSEIEDIRKAYEQSDLLLAPIFGPGGTRYKVLEAMASGVPVVTTPFGIEGLGVENDAEALIRLTPIDLAEAAIEVLTDDYLYKKLSMQANALVRTTYNWERIGKSLDDVYENVAHEKN